MKLSKSIAIFLLAVIMVFTLIGCSNGSEPEQTTGTSGESEKTIKVALVGNQKFGDRGSMDQMLAGLEKARDNLGVKITTLESDGVAAHEDNVRAMANAGYDLIITTFPDMSQATVTVANEYPDVSFGAVYQFINDEDTQVPNVYDAQFQGQEAMYILGAMAAKLTRTNQIGMIVGAEEPSPNADGNAFMTAVKKYNPDADVQFAYIGDYEDIAKGKEIALAMIAADCDVIQTDAGKPQVGIFEAAKEANILVCGDTSDYSEYHPEGAYGFFGGDFTNVVYLMIKDYVEDNFKGGTTGVMNLANGSFFLTPDMFDSFKENRPDYAEEMGEAIELYDELYAQVMAGELQIPFDTKTPDWSNYK